MKNCKLKTCIFENYEDFVKICREIFKDFEGFDVDFDSVESIYFCAISNEDVYKKLADYYGVKKIRSIHSDHYEMTGVWIVYE